MSASMAEVLAEHYIASLVEGGWACYGKDCETDWGRFEEAMEHVAEQLAANGYGKLEATRFVLAEREAELLNLKGPCRAPQCRLHHAHRGPCDTRRPE